MDGFRNKFIKLANDIKEGNILSTELDKYVKENSTKSMFSSAIKSLMEDSSSYVKIFAAKYSFEYGIDQKRAYYISRYILRKEKDLSCRVEAKYIYDRYHRRYISKLISFLLRKKIGSIVYINKCML